MDRAVWRDVASSPKRVKELANQTAAATEDIGTRIEAIQTDAREAVKAISEIMDVINKVNEISSSIASAVEEQTATTSEIGRAVLEAARGSSEISTSITNVAQAAERTTAGAVDMQGQASDLAQMAGQLRELVSRFRYQT